MSGWRFALPVCVLLTVVPHSAQATFPGTAGPLAFERYPVSPAGTSSDIFTFGRGDAAPVARAATADDERQPAFSPNGSKIAFTATPVGSPDPRPGEASAYTEIYVMDADGANRTRLTSNETREQDPAFSADGERIAFSRYRHDRGYDIYMIDADDGGNQTRLTGDPGFDIDPAPSPDGERIAFSSNSSGSYEIYTMNADGTDVSRLTDNPALDFAPDFSPDGGRIAFTREVAGNYDIYVIDADGTSERRLTTSPDIDLWPSFSPQGDAIAYSTLTDHGGVLDYELRTMKPDGSGEQSRLLSPGLNETAPAWGPQPFTAPECFDRQDNDGDARVDRADPGCESSADDSESPDPRPPGAGSHPTEVGGHPTEVGAGGRGGAASAQALAAEAARARALRACLRSAARGRTDRLRRRARRRCLVRHGRTPGRVSALRARSLSLTRVLLSFRAPGTDRGRGAPARTYLVKQSTRPLGGRRGFRRAQSLCGGRCRVDAGRIGERVSLVITGLRPRATYYYAVAARDNVSGRLGPRSRAVRVRTR